MALWTVRKKMQLGHGEARASMVVFNSYVVTEAGEQYLQSPCFQLLIPLTISNANKSLTGKKTQRQSKGKHLLPMLSNLLSSSENWYTIESSEDYQYPGLFRVE